MSNLLLGHNGYLGSYLYDCLDCDILNTRELKDNGQKYDFVINCIGKPDLEYCESNINETNYSNAEVIRDIQKFYPQSKIINFSSYYVYDHDGLCFEDSYTTDAYHYCRQKLLGEQYNSSGLNFRIGKLFGNLKGKQHKLTEHIIFNDELYIDDANFNPTSTQIVLKVLQNEQFLREQSGVFNLANDCITSHYNFARYILYKLKSNKKLYKAEKNRSFSNYGRFVMSIDKIKQYFDIPSWKHDMDEYLKCTALVI